MTLCYSYIRLSTDLQLTGDGLDRQMQKSREYAAKHDLILDETLRDLGVSGFTGENATRGALAQFLKRVESGLVPQGSVLIVESLDRLSRDKVTRAMCRFLALINAGITIVTLADNERRYDVETITADPTALMMSLLVMTRAHEESAVKSMRVRAAFERKRERAHKGEAILTAKCPSWLRLADDKKTWEVIEEKAKWVRLTFELAAEGMGMHGIVRYLNAQSAPPLAHGKGSHLSYIDSLLKERKVLGEVQLKLRTTCHKRIPRGDPVQNYYPAIVDPDLYMRVQAGLAQRKKGGGRKGDRYANLFGKLCRCGVCGGTMTVIRSENSQGKICGPYLRCNNQARKMGTCSHKRYHRYEDIEAAILDNVREYELASLFQASRNDDPLIPESYPHFT